MSSPALPTPKPPGRRVLPQITAAATPPFRLPAEHFGAALAWLLVGAVLLPLIAPRLASGRALEPPVFALVHAAVLGVVGSAVFGALYQFVPGGLGVPLKSVRIGHLGFWLYEAGTVVLVAGFWWWQGWLQLFGWILVFGAVGAVSLNVLPARRRSVQGKQVGLFISVAHSALGVGMAIGLARIGETLGWWHLDRLGALAAHALVGTVGFGTLTAIGVGSRMLPTFLLAPGDDRRRLQAILGLVSGGLTVFSLGALLGPAWLARAGAILLLAAGVAILALGQRWFRRRGRTLDPSLWHVIAAFVGMAVATLLGVGLLAGNSFDLARWSALLTALILGWLAMLVLGVMAKILSHLSYNNLFGVMPGFARLGNPNLLLRADWMAASGALLGGGALGLTMAIDLGRPGVALIAAAAWSGGAILTVANYVRMVVVGRAG